MEGGRTNPVTITPPPPIDLQAVGPDWPDEIADLSDRRRLLLGILFGADVPPAVADAVFERQSSSTTTRSGGRSSSTDER